MMGMEMGVCRSLGLFALIPTTVLLTISFFVLFANSKVEMQGLKSFGRVIAVLLWISAALVFSVGAFVIATGQHPMKLMMKGGCCPMMMGGMEGKMMKGDMHAMPMDQMKSGKMQKCMPEDKQKK
jgi:hypothetical protein